LARIVLAILRFYTQNNFLPGNFLYADVSPTIAFGLNKFLLYLNFIGKF